MLKIRKIDFFLLMNMNAQSTSIIIAKSKILTIYVTLQRGLITEWVSAFTKTTLTSLDKSRLELLRLKCERVLYAISYLQITRKPHDRDDAHWVKVKSRRIPTSTLNIRSSADIWWSYTKIEVIKRSTKDSCVPTIGYLSFYDRLMVRLSWS